MQLIRRIDVPVRDIRWSDSGELVAIVSESSFYILRLDNQAVDAFLASGEEAEDDGLEDAFELLNEVSERVRTGTPETRMQGDSTPRHFCQSWCRPSSIVSVVTCMLSTATYLPSQGSSPLSSPLLAYTSNQAQPFRSPEYHQSTTLEPSRPTVNTTCMPPRHRTQVKLTLAGSFAADCQLT